MHNYKLIFVQTHRALVTTVKCDGSVIYSTQGCIYKDNHPDSVTVLMYISLIS